MVSPFLPQLIFPSFFIIYRSIMLARRWAVWLVFAWLRSYLDHQSILFLCHCCFDCCRKTDKTNLNLKISIFIGLAQYVFAPYKYQERGMPPSKLGVCVCVCVCERERERERERSLAFVASVFLFPVSNLNIVILK